MSKVFSPQFLLPDENAQQVHEELFRLLLEFRDYAIIRIDPFGHIISWNEGAEHIYGFSIDDVLGKHISVFFTEEDKYTRQPWVTLGIAARNGRYEHEGWKYRKNGTKFYGNIILTAFYNSNNELSGFAKVTRDITQQKQLEEENLILKEHLEEKVNQRTRELEIVNKELEAFSYSVSHDLRAPLRAVSGYSNMLKEDYQVQLDEDGNRLIDKIVENSRLMGHLIDDLLSFSKMARSEVISSEVNMKQLAEECLMSLSDSENQDAYSIRVLELPACRGDKSMLNQVWFNLLSNAIKYSSKTINPLIEIGTIENANSNVYYVRDNGSGFNMKYADKLFGVFQRLHRHDEFEGTGLGLALAKRIVSKHLGEIWGEASPGK